MREPSRVHLALVGGAAAVAGVLAWLESATWLDWIFGTFMLSCLAFVARLGVRAWREAVAEQARAVALASTAPDDVAREAVAEERVRLSEDVAACIRSAVEQVAAELRDLPAVADPQPGLRRIHGHARAATSELRRMLGLLRGSEEPLPSDPPAPVRRRTPSARDVTIGLIISVVAAVETAGYITETPHWFAPGSIALTAAAGATLVARTTWPVASALVCAALYWVGASAGAPVTSGLWAVITLGALMWTLSSAPRRTPTIVAGAIALPTSVGLTMTTYDPANIGVLLVSMLVAAAGGDAVRRYRRRHRLAQGMARTHEQDLAAVTDAAVRAERVVIARELHDVVSHAVGVIALQAAAAEMSWLRDREAALRAIEVIDNTTSATLLELDRLTPAGGSAARHTTDDLRALVDRIRAVGTRVDLTLVGRPAVESVVYRVVQETLTNAVRHAPGARVRVLVVNDDSGTVVRVSDDGPGPAPRSPRGYGLVGLAERVAFVNGTLETGPGTDGRGFTVTATLPRRTEMAVR